MKYRFEARTTEGVLNKTFKTREKANRFLDKYLESHNLEVQDIINVNDNVHNIEYICNDYNRFLISRI